MSESRSEHCENSYGTPKEHRRNTTNTEEILKEHHHHRRNTEGIVAVDTEESIASSVAPKKY